MEYLIYHKPQSNTFLGYAMSWCLLLDTFIASSVSIMHLELDLLIHIFILSPGTGYSKALKSNLTISCSRNSS